MVIEEWRKIKGFERYEVSNHGRIKSNTKVQGLIMKQTTHYKGYKQIFLYIENAGNIDRKFFIHRLVAEAFLENPDNLPFVNHKDLNKGNNYIENLEWIDESGNAQHWRALRKENLSDDSDEF